LLTSSGTTKLATKDHGGLYAFLTKTVGSIDDIRS